MKIANKKLDNIYGGTLNIPATTFKYITDVVKVLLDAGRSLGSSIRRIQEGKICVIE